jgi:TBC1 domain family member 15
MRLWEALWGSQDKLLHLFCALAILRQHKHKMMQQEMEFDDVLKFVNGLALHIDCLQTLKDADSMSQMARHHGMS